MMIWVIKLGNLLMKYFKKVEEIYEPSSSFNKRYKFDLKKEIGDNDIHQIIESSAIFKELN